MVLFDYGHRSFRVLAVAITVLFSISLPIQSFAFAPSPNYPVVREVEAKKDNVFKKVRVYAQKMPKGNYVGFFATTGVALVGEGLYDRYEQGQFDVLAEDAARAASELFTKGRPVAEKLLKRFEKLREKFECVADGECYKKDAQPKSWSRTWQDLTFNIQNRSVYSKNLAELVAQRDGEIVQANARGWKDYVTGGQLVEVCILGACSEDVLDNFAKSELTSAVITVKFNRFCNTGSIYNGCTGESESIQGYKVIVTKPKVASEVDSKPLEKVKVGVAEVQAEMQKEPLTDEEVAETLATCAVYDGCGPVAKPKSKTSTPTAIETPTGYNPPNVAYPSKPSVRTGSPAAIKEEFAKPDYVRSSEEQVKHEEGTPSTGGSSSPLEWVEFCSWATPVCEFIDWVKQEPEVSEEETKPVSELQPEYEDVKVHFQAQCPQPLVFQVGRFGSQAISYQPLCDLATQLQPFVIFLGYFSAAFIVIGISRGGGSEE